MEYLVDTCIKHWLLIHKGWAKKKSNHVLGLCLKTPNKWGLSWWQMLDEHISWPIPPPPLWKIKFYCCHCFITKVKSTHRLLFKTRVWQKWNRRKRIVTFLSDFYLYSFRTFDSRIEIFFPWLNLQRKHLNWDNGSKTIFTLSVKCQSHFERRHKIFTTCKRFAISYIWQFYAQQNYSKRQFGSVKWYKDFKRKESTSTSTIS